MNVSTIWLTGYSGAGKTTLAQALECRIKALGRGVFVLDGDVIRQGLCGDLGFSLEDRSENIRRVAEVTRLFNQAGLIVIVALISPLRADRERARQIIGSDSFNEVWLSTSLAECEQRDVKGLYAKARQGLITGFTGISSPYEVPLQPHLILDTAAEGLHDCVDQIWALLQTEAQPVT